MIANFYSVNTAIMANFKLPIVELGPVFCSEVQKQGIPAPMSWTQPKRQLAWPQLPSAGMLTQLPLNLGKGTEGRLACPGSSSDLPPPRHLRGLAQGAPHSRLWSTPAWASPLQQSQLIVFPTQFSYPHGMVIGLGQNEGRESFLFLATWLGHSDISCLFISPVNLSGCPTLSPLSRKISPFSGRKDSSVSQCLLPIQSWS